MVSERIMLVAVTVNFSYDVLTNFSFVMFKGHPEHRKWLNGEGIDTAQSTG